ncbi:MAG TPA: glycoside hydrolase family 44 protein [Bryobacteraceae bacterium]|nr:glycoside hydrolase family 44 protein [Bryobacteraceae bacterium]
MRRRPHLLAASLSVLSLTAQTAPTLAVDANANRHPISPYIYGINEWSDDGLFQMMHIPVLRWGGDDATSYNWQTSTKNNTGDNPWCYENYSVSPDFDQFHTANLSAGTISLGTIPLMDWSPKDAGECSFSVAKYGPQKSTNPDNSDCGSGFLVNGDQVKNDPNDAYVPVTQSLSQQWIQHIMTTYGPANAGGVRLWSMDNEPEWWYANHMDVYPQPATYNDMMARNLKWAQAVKSTDPTALVTGPVPGGWSGMLFSSADMTSGWQTSPYQYWDNPVDQNAHGGIPWVPYYLQQMNQFEQANGVRLVDYLDVHAYITPGSLSSSAGDATMETLRMTSTRALWDPNYIVPDGGIYNTSGTQVAPQLIPQMQQWVAQNYPGTNLAITEYSWGALDTITGAIAQADILGIFGAYGLGLGTLWGAPAPTDPGAFAFQIFLNYDGNGSPFGGTGVSATSGDPDTLSVFAAQRFDSALTVLVLNKTTSAITDSVSLANFTPAGTAQVWQYSQANLGAIVRQTSDINVSGNSLNATFPAYSMTLLVIPQAQNAMAVPQPVVSAVQSAASYDASGIAPGEIVAIYGQGLGPASFTSLQVNSNGTLSNSIGGVQVFFNGYPSPMIYALAGQLSAIVPYEIAGQTSVNVVVVYQANASAPFSAPVAPSKPGIFTNDASGKNQGAILNQDYSRNGPANPASRGQYVLIYGTGEGVTSPPGVDGRISGKPLPSVSLNCTATIGSVTAMVSYCGEAPGATAGLVQVNAQVPESVTPGPAVPISINIGGLTSQAGVTVAVK